MSVWTAGPRDDSDRRLTERGHRMNRKAWPALTAVVLGTITAWMLPWPLPAQSPAAGATGPPKAKKTKTEADEVFGLNKAHTFHLEFTAKEWQALQAVRGGMFSPKPPPDAPGADSLEYHKGNGTEYPWARADFTAGGRTF